ncbi:MAG: peptide chain release factor 2 [Nitrospirota bacterium]
MLEDYQSRFETLRQRTIALRGYLDPARLTDRLDELERLTAEPNFWNDQRKAKSLTQEKARLVREMDQWRAVEGMLDDVTAAFELSKGGDNSLLAELSAQLDALDRTISALEQEKMLSGDKDINSAIVTIHPGAGGTESQDWAQMLMRMYTRWAERAGYKVQVLDLQPGDEAGIKSVTFTVNGEYAYGRLRAEAGVHRLVRISPFDANKRRHTSFASVFVYPEIEDDIDIVIDEKDLRIDTYRASSAGGQHVNKTSSAIRITHIPTGVVTQCQNERSQHQNKEVAMKVLRAELYALEQQKKEEEMAKLTGEKKDIAWGSQIRSYVFQPYQMVKDHRTGKEVGQVSAVMDGEIDPFIEAYLMQRAAGASAKK